MGFLSSIFSSAWGYLAAGVFSALIAGAGVGWTVDKIKDDQYQQLVAKDAQAQVAAVETAKKLQARTDGIALDAAVSEAIAQQQIVTQTVTITKKVPVYVTPKQDSVACISVGLARVLRAAAAGVDPGTLNLPPGQSDDACSDATPSEVASWFTQYAGAARANAQQLNDLEATVREQIAATKTD